MRFHLWRRSDRAANSACPEADPSVAESATRVDADLWAQTAQGDTEIEGEALVDGEPGSLRDKLLAVLADEEASLVPPSAGGMTIDQWAGLTDAERERFRRRQLRRVDPRFVPETTSNNGSRSTRVYR